MSERVIARRNRKKNRLSNALFGLNWRTDYAIACTQIVTQYEVKMLSEISQGKDLTWQLCETLGVIN